jgi:hypothetical protein
MKGSAMPVPVTIHELRDGTATIADLIESLARFPQDAKAQIFHNYDIQVRPANCRRGESYYVTDPTEKLPWLK